MTLSKEVLPVKESLSKCCFVIVDQAYPRLHPSHFESSPGIPPQLKGRGFTAACRSNTSVPVGCVQIVSNDNDHLIFTPN
ncbi:unnamed protein product [Allacma fusca]|uniref:Uncharacterized protein n=1 Tax=Allacma fusca TaxID=39272 RepID=A0A8J2JRF4_9HEXA|nr:unnamed protein product [Allacma fusca]